jgi:protein-S-isoprenylcysteine O-methyltransferase Ste14
MVTYELALRMIFSALWLVFLAGLGWVINLTKSTTRRQLSRSIGLLRVAAGILAVPYFAGAIAYVFVPTLVDFYIPLPTVFRLMIACISVLAMLFFVWALGTLGRNWAPSTTGVRSDSVLITSGPFGIVRNPIYLSLLILIPCMAMLAASWLMFIPGLFISIGLYLQTGREEAELVGHFGDKYREYMKRTPRLIPKIRKSASGARDSTVE